MGLEGGEGRATPHAGREGGGVFGPCREGFVGFIWEPTEEHGEAMAGGRSHIMPCPGTGVDGNPNYGLRGRDNLLWVTGRAVLGSCRSSVQG